MFTIDSRWRGRDACHWNREDALVAMIWHISVFSVVAESDGRTVNEAIVGTGAVALNETRYSRVLASASVALLTLKNGETTLIGDCKDDDRN